MSGEEYNYTFDKDGQMHVEKKIRDHNDCIPNQDGECAIEVITRNPDNQEEWIAVSSFGDATVINYCPFCGEKLT